MALRVFNTLTRRKEDFAPLVPGEVRMYVCGVTVYDLCHIGHARSAIVFDVIRRYLRFRGYRVTFVKNYTDVDDRIIRKANDEGVTAKVISEAWDLPGLRRHYDDFIAAGGSFAKAKEAGHWRLEGKGYEVRDGDIINIRHG